MEFSAMLPELNREMEQFPGYIRLVEDMQEVDMSLFSPSHSIEELRMEMTEIIFRNNSVSTLLDSGGHARSGCVFILPFLSI